MFFTQKPTTILFVQRDSLSLYPKNSTEPLRLSEDMFKYLEIRDEKKCRQQVAEFAKKANLRSKRILILLGKDIVFQKAATIEGDHTVASLTADFEHILPFDHGDQRALGYQQKDRLFLFGSNRSFYQLLAEELERAGGKVMGVTPAVIYGITEPAKLTPAKFEQICDVPRLTKALDFLTHS